MPRARLPIHSKTTGPERIGAALNERWHEINRRAIETAKARLDAAFNSIAQPIIDAADEEALSDRGYQGVTEYRGPILISPIFIYLRQYDLQTADVPFDQT